MRSSTADSLLVRLALAAVVVVSCCCGIHAVFFEALDPDEFQHVHLAWEVAQGKTLYQELFDNHGPLFSLFNSLSFSLLSLNPGASVFSGLRMLSLLYMCAIGALLFNAGMLITGDRLFALSGAAIFASLGVVLDKGVEIRPDTLQNLFWVGSFALLARDPRARSVHLQLAAGTLMGLAIACNTKAGICLLAVLAYFCSEIFVSRERLRMLRAQLPFLSSCAAILVAFAVGFAAWGALADFARYTLIFPFHLLAHHGEEGYLLGTQLHHYVFEQGLFVGLSLAGAVLVAGEVRRNPADSRRRLLLIVPIVSTLALFLGTYDQTMLMCLPPMALLAAYPLLRLFRRFPRWPLRLIFIAVVFFPLCDFQIRHTRSSLELRRTQDQLTETMLRLTEREEPVGYLWSFCGGYTFNELSQWRWMGNFMVSLSLDSLHGSVGLPGSYGQLFLDSLEQRGIRYLITDDFGLRQFTEPQMSELRARFEQDGCLWTRRP